jgi:sterol desaturase/sphingolipid hydroxylase (fatty acid hydroxylase superfamily)
MNATRHLLANVGPIYLIAILFEVWFLVRRRGVSYDWREAVASFGIALGQRFINAGAAVILVAVYSSVWAWRPWTVPLNHAWSIGLLFVLVEFAYYWQHRLSHESRWFWATHAVHHSPRHLYLANADRLGWTGQLTGSFLFFLPLAYLGFAPAAIVGALSVNLLYQFWLHTELIGKLSWFDWFFNSPSNHRVHHGTHPLYLDRNYGGIVMIYDHLFGTYTAERDELPREFGLVSRRASYNPLRIAFGEWFALCDDVRHARGWRQTLGFVLGPPGWQPDGQGLTSARLRLSGEAVHL